MCSSAYERMNPSVPDTVYVIGADEFHSYSEIEDGTAETNKPAFLSIFDTTADELPSPSDWVKESQIHIYNDKIIIDIDSPQWSEFTDTNSMDPVIDTGANAIEIVPSSPGQIHVGDIISYESQYAEGTIIHRVVETGTDSSGWYCFVKGDNLPTQDPGKIRFDQIRRVVVAVVY